MLFHSALQGVRFLHSHRWIHRDLKPQNIGYTGSQAVLLDIGGAIRLDPGALAPATPGRGGTVPYLAPECEMQDYDDRVDIWSMAIILCELLFGSHPWMTFKNPWRAGHERLRDKFDELYEQQIKKIGTDPRAKQGESISHMSPPQSLFHG
jgi:serine/threonine protein kinase